MSGKTRAFFISLSILALLAISAFGTVPAYADDGTTSGSTETTTTTGTDQDTSTSGDGEQPAGDPSTTGEEQQPTDGTTSEAQPEVAAPPILEQLPENTTVTVVDESGAAQPLVSQESAEAVLLSDPIWCPEGQSPTPGENGCTPSFTSFTDLLTYIEENGESYQQAGTIYVQQGAYLGGEEVIDFNSYNLTNISQHNLTITGGWNTSDNSVDSNSTSELNVPLVIGSSGTPWGGSLTLNSIIINGAGGQTGLTLYSSGDINLNNVEVTNSENGAELNAGGNVTVKKSKFHKNGSGNNVDFNGTDAAINPEATGAGLSITGGAITLEEVNASNNQLYGANITATGAVTITGSFFNGNVSYAFPPSGDWEHYGYGLQVVTDQTILLNNVTANGNQLFGANLDGASVEINNSSFNENGSLFEEDPTGYGLKVNSSGAVTLQSVNANDNELYGANIEAGSSVIIRQSFFNGNSSYEYVSNDIVYHGYGLSVVTVADIALRDVEANENYQLGAYLEGSDVAIRSASFSNNGSGTGLDVIGRGLEIVGISNPDFSNGEIGLRDIVADNNQLYGANIQTPGNVAISGVNSFSGHITYVYDANTGNVLSTSGGYGLDITAGGEIALRGITATGNYLYGANLDGAEVAIADGVFSNNGTGVETDPVGYGIKIKSTGAVSINNIEANNNQLFGADIVAADNISIQTGYFSGHQSVAIAPCGGLTFYGYGLTANSTAGDVILNGVEANFNNLWGGKLDGENVYVSNSKFNNNVTDSSQFIDDTGLIVNSRGDVSLDVVEAKENRLTGADIKAVGVVDISSSTFTGNAGITCQQAWCPPGSEIYHGYGLNVVTLGLINLDGVNASDNHLYGAHLEGGTVEVKNSSFNNNGTGAGNTPLGRGLEVISEGTVVISMIEANGNQLFGANIDAAGDVTVTASDFTGNYHLVGTSPEGYGLQIATPGNITLVSDTGGFGLNGSQNGSGAILQGNNISVTDSKFNNNGSGNGLTITATGTVELTNVTATSNGGNGVEVTTTGSCVQVNGGTFTGNAQYGIYVSGAPLNLDGTQTFSGNGSGDTFTDTPGTCVVAPVVVNGVTTSLILTAPVVASSNTSTTVSSNSTNENTTVSNNTSKKTIKAKKAHAKKVKHGSAKRKNIRRHR